MPKVTGIVKVHVNGELQRSKEGATLETGGFERTKQVGHRVYGSSEKVVPSVLEYTLAHTSDTDVIALNALVDATVRFETDVGITYLLANCDVTSPCKITGGEGDCEVTMSGDPAVEE